VLNSESNVRKEARSSQNTTLSVISTPSGATFPQKTSDDSL